MKKIIAVIALTILLTSCGAMNNNQVKQNNTGEQTTKTNVKKTMNNKTEVVDLSPDEEKIIQDLLK